MIDENEILKLWHDNNWKGSYTGIRTFQTLLKTDKNITVSEKTLYRILRNDPLYLKHLKPHRKIERRSYNLNYYGELIQGDIAYMFDDNEFKYFLVLIDCYSLKVFTKPLKTKNSVEVFDAFKYLIKQFQISVTKIEVDQGTEFSKVKSFCKDNNIIFKYKFGNNKANFAEWIIMVLKRRLYKLLRDKLSHNWTKYLTKISDQFNDTPQKKIGFLKPNQIKSIFDSAFITSNNKQKQNVLPTYKKQFKNQTLYENNKDFLQKGDFVYLDFKQELFGKSFDIQVFHFKAKIDCCF